MDKHYRQSHLMKIMQQTVTKSVSTSSSYPYTTWIQDAFAGVKVSNRLMSLNPRRILQPMTDDLFAQHNELLTRATTDLAKGSILKVLHESEVDIGDIDQHMWHTTTYQVPAGDVMVNAELGFRPDTTRHPISASGCVGGISLFHHGRTKVNTNNIMLLATSAEVASQSWSAGFGPSLRRTLRRYEEKQIEEPEFKRQLRNVFISAALFGDGAASVLFVDESHPIYQRSRRTSPSRVFPRVLTSYSEAVPDTQNVVEVYPSRDGIHIEIGKELPTLGTEHALRVIELALYKVEIDDIDEVKHWIVHPGGPKILDLLQQKLKLPSSALRHSFASLEEHGNCGSVSVLDVLMRAMNDKGEDRFKKNDIVVMIGFGPGMVIEVVVLRCD